MTFLLSSGPDVEIRAICKEKIESLEHWLRRLIHDMLCPAYGDYFSYVDSKGNRLIRSQISLNLERRRAQAPERYPREIDAVLLDEAIDIICNPSLYQKHFREAIHYAFPDGREEARTFLRRILEHRNNLAHANAISNRAAERVVCYSNDVIDSLKTYYRAIGMNQEYDVPLILRISDSFGQTFTRQQCAIGFNGVINLNFRKPELFYVQATQLVLTLK